MGGVGIVASGYGHSPAGPMMDGMNQRDRMMGAGGRGDGAPGVRGSGNGGARGAFGPDGVGGGGDFGPGEVVLQGGRRFLTNTGSSKLYLFC